MNNRLRNVAVHIVFTLAVTGCFGPGGSTGKQPSPDPKAALNALLDDYESHAANGALEKFAELYAYPMTFVLNEHNQWDWAESEDDLKAKYAVDQLRQMIDMYFPANVAADINPKSVQLLNINEVEDDDEDIGDDDGILYAFDVVMTLEVNNPNAARVFLPGPLFDFKPNDDDSDEAAAPKLISYRLLDLVMSTHGDSNVATATSEVILGWGVPEVNCTITALEVFTFLRAASGWKIQEHEHTSIDRACFW